MGLGILGLESIKEVRKVLVILARELVVVHTMLVRPDTGQDAGPARAADRVALRISLAEYLRVGCVGTAADQLVQVRCPGHSQSVRSNSVQPDRQYTLGPGCFRTDR